MKPEGEKQHPLAAKINYYKNRTGYTTAQIAKMLGISRATMNRRLLCPEEITIGELVGLMRLFATSDFLSEVKDLAGL